MARRGRATQQLRDTSKATSTLFPIKMIAKLESFNYGHKVTHKQKSIIESHNGSYNQQ